MAWVYLLLAGACEMAWPIGFKYTHGFRAHWPAVAGTMALMCLSFWLMSVATNKGIPVGTAYAVWTGLGAAGTAVLGMILFKESADAMRIACLALIILGVIGLKLHATASASTSASTSATVAVANAQSAARQ
jgi:quaternary ammonium compound-resistance protein SugE